MAQFHHFGVPTNTQHKDSIYIEAAKVHITDAEKHPFKIEFLRFEDGSPMHPDVINNAHAAFMVDDLDAELKGKNVIIEPFEATETLRVAFIKEDQAVIELMENI